jgi:murein DD-endopeptidase MepM/ murein hydrolase activator NlpD
MDADNLSGLGSFAIRNGQTQRAEALATSAVGKDKAEQKKAAQEFASLLFLEVLKAMRAATPQGGFSENDGLSRDIYTSMMDTEIARLMAKQDASGLSQTIEKALDKLANKVAPSNAPVQPSRGSDAEAPPIRSSVLPQAIAKPTPNIGVVSSGFGPRRDPFDGVTRMHDGVDIAVPAGTPIAAAAGGKVIFSGAAGGYGNMVEIAHDNGLVTRYAHTAANLVTVGDAVKLGQSIALVGNTGRSTGPHLHFEVRRDGKPVDPATLLGALVKGSKVSTAA